MQGFFYFSGQTITNMKRIIARLCFLAATLFSTGLLHAKEIDDSTQLMIEAIRQQMDSIESTLKYKTGILSLANGIATINVPEGYRFLEAADAKFVLEDLWGNPPSGEKIVGLLFPANSGATDPEGYTFVVSYEAMGYVKDDDAGKIDYNELLTELKKGSDEDNKERERLNLTTMDLVGWAAQPYYDKDKKVLYWAKEFSIPEAEENTLNYDIRVLGRKGVLVLQAIAGMSAFDTVNAHIVDVLQMVAFTKGNTYADFDSKTDDVAAWTIGGLVVGKILAKAGFFAVLLKFIKPILIGVALAGGVVWRYITGRRKRKEELLTQTVDSAGNDPGTT